MIYKTDHKDGSQAFLSSKPSSDPSLSCVLETNNLTTHQSGGDHNAYVMIPEGAARGN